MLLVCNRVKKVYAHFGTFAPKCQKIVLAVRKRTIWTDSSDTSFHIRPLLINCKAQNLWDTFKVFLFLLVPPIENLRITISYLLPLSKLADQLQSTLMTYFPFISETRLKKQSSNKKQIIADPNPIARIKKALVKSNKRIATWRADFFWRLLSKHSAALRWPKILSTQKYVSPVSHNSMSLEIIWQREEQILVKKTNFSYHRG